jgi:DNA repair exonuclease SbcCD ATPase subunit
MPKKIIIISILLFFFVASAANAQNKTATRSARPQSVPNRLLEEKAERAELKLLIQEKQQEKRLEIQTKRQEFQAKLQEIKDERKQTIVENTDERLAEINLKATNRLSSAIEKLETLLDKFAERVDEAKTEGKDTSEAETAILEAESAIEEAKIAVAEQAAREYVAEIETEETLGSTVGQTVSSLRQDIKTTFESVKNAKRKVMDVARAVAHLRSREKVATPSAALEAAVTVTPGSEL